MSGTKAKLLTILFGAAGLAARQGFADDTTSTGTTDLPAPTHQWAFDIVTEGRSPDSGTSGHAIEAKIVNAQLAAGKFGQSLDFPADGTTSINVNGTNRDFVTNTTSYAEIEIPFSDIIDRGFTLTAWVQAGTQPQGYGTIFTSGRNYGFEVRAAHDWLSLSSNGDWNAVRPNQSIFKDGTQWNHVAMTFTPQTAALYANGKLLGTHDTSAHHEFWRQLFLGGYDLAEADQKIKSDQIPFQQGLVGKIDDVCLYEQVLTDAQIAHLAQDTKP